MLDSSWEELRKSSTFLVDDCCVFGVEILKVDVSSPEKKAVLVDKKASTVQNLFVQKKGLIKGTYTWKIKGRAKRRPTYPTRG